MRSALTLALSLEQEARVLLRGWSDGRPADPQRACSASAVGHAAVGPLAAADGRRPNSGAQAHLRPGAPLTSTVWKHSRHCGHPTYALTTPLEGGACPDPSLVCPLAQLPRLLRRARLAPLREEETRDLPSRREAMRNVRAATKAAETSVARAARLCAGAGLDYSPAEELELDLDIAGVEKVRLVTLHV